MWMQRWSHSTRAGQAAIPDSRRPDIRIGRAPQPNRLVGDCHASLREEIFDIAKAHTEAVRQPDGVADDLGGKSISMVAQRVVVHRPSLPRSH